MVCIYSFDDYTDLYQLSITELIHFDRFVSDFSRKQTKEIPTLLDQFLKQVAKTGETL